MDSQVGRCRSHARNFPVYLMRVCDVFGAAHALMGRPVGFFVFANVLTCEPQTNYRYNLIAVGALIFLAEPHVDFELPLPT
jgi:hypothetical protein